MRDLIFRGWDDETKTMLSPQDLSQSGEYWNWLGKIDVLLEQFTGLLDKKGKEIYEGDIVETEDGHKLKVIWGYCGWGLEHLDGFSAVGFVGRTNLKVIGNIHEHPELLK